MNELDTDKATIIENKFLTPKKETVIRLGTIGDGSCFFHSICLCLNKNHIWQSKSYILSKKDKRQEIALALRNYIADHVTEDLLKTVYKEMRNKNAKINLEDLKTKLRTLKTWANEVIIRVTSKILKKNIIFLNLMKNTMFCEVHDDDTERSTHCTSEDSSCALPNDTIIVAWVNYKHFELIGIAESKSGVCANVKVQFNDKPTIKFIMDHYFQSCGKKV
jgi:hypothetical protein